MTTAAEQRYRVPESDHGVGHDLLLDRPVTVTRLASADPERIARALRGLPPSPWLKVLDTYTDHNDVVVVLPASKGSLADQLSAGVPAHRATALAQALPAALEALRAIGLAPRSLHPAAVPAADGQLLLLPANGPRDLTEERDGLLTSLGEGDRPPATAPEQALQDDRATTEIPRTAAVHEPDRVSTVRFPRAGLTIAETGGGVNGGGRRRALLVTAGAAAAVLATGLVLTQQADTVPPAGSAQSAAQAPAAPAPVADPLAAPADLDALVTLVQQDPAAFGPRTPKFEGRLVALRDELTGEAARTEAEALVAIISAGPAKGEFTATFASLATPVLRPLSVPADLAALVAATQVEPARFGPRVPVFSGRLDKLQSLTGEAAQVEAADLVAIVTAGVDKGEFTANFRDLALPVLEPLAAPS